MYPLQFLAHFDVPSGHFNGVEPKNGVAPTSRGENFDDAARTLDSAADMFTVRPMRLRAPAKINLHLRVGPRREDGFHPLLSWMVTVGLFDELTFERETAGRITLTCDMPGLPCDERNLVLRIALAWKAERRPDASGLAISLRKRIPVGAGLGGGSSDAARTLEGLNRLWRTGGAANDLSAFAARFGSDLSFFFHGPSGICRGRGETVSPAPRLTACQALLVLPNLSLSTPQVYRRFDEMRLGRAEDLENAPDWNQWAGLSSEKLLPRLVNDLEPAAFDISPRLAELRDRIERRLGRPVRMSGSGSSLFTLYDDPEQARTAAERAAAVIEERVIPVEVSPLFHDDLDEDGTMK